MYNFSLHIYIFILVLLSRRIKAYNCTS